MHAQVSRRLLRNGWHTVASAICWNYATVYRFFFFLCLLLLPPLLLLLLLLLLLWLSCAGASCTHRTHAHVNRYCDARCACRCAYVMLVSTYEMVMSSSADMSRMAMSATPACVTCASCCHASITRAHGLHAWLASECNAYNARASHRGVGNGANRRVSDDACCRCAVETIGAT